MPVTGLDVFEAVPFLWQGAHALGGDGQFHGVNGHLPGAGADQVAPYAQMVADVQVFDQVEAVFQVVLPEEGLDGAGGVLEVEKGGLAHGPYGGDPSGEGDI